MGELLGEPALLTGVPSPSSRRTKLASISARRASHPASSCLRSLTASQMANCCEFDDMRQIPTRLSMAGRLRCAVSSAAAASRAWRRTA